MTTFDTDFVRLFMVTGSHTVPCKAFGLEWPPPETITHLNGVELPAPMTRRQMSVITDEQMAKMTNVARGAVYRYEDDEDDRT